MQTQHRLLQIGAHSLFCRFSGNGNEAVVLLHGIPTNSYLWTQLFLTCQKSIWSLLLIYLAADGRGELQLKS
jgi:pimeloyl-ACP methyl ester carboxylesterase